MIDIGSKEVGEGGESARTEKGALGLSVVDASGEAVGVGCEGCCGFSEEVVGEKGTAKRLSEEADAGEDFWLGGSGRCGDEGDSVLEVLSVGGGEGGEGGDFIEKH